MKTSNVFQSINGQVYRTEKAAREFYGERFDSMLENNLLFKFIIDMDGEVVGEWE